MKKALTVALATLMVVGVSACNSAPASSEADLPSEESSYTEELVREHPEIVELADGQLGDMTFRYPARASVEESTDNGISIIMAITDDYAIQIGHSPHDIYLQENSILHRGDEYAEATRHSAVEMGKTPSLTEAELTKLGGKDWAMFTMTADDIELTTYVRPAAYDIYSITIRYFTDDNRNEVNLFLNSIGWEETEDGKLEAIEFLTGEWDCGNSGYFVFEDSGKFYCYKDSTKSPLDCFSGQYVPDNKIPTNAAGYTDGYYIIVNYDTQTVDGVMKFSEYSIIYTFVPTDNPDVCEARNLDAGTFYTATRMGKSSI